MPYYRTIFPVELYVWAADDRNAGATVLQLLQEHLVTLDTEPVTDGELSQEQERRLDSPTGYLVQW